MPDLKLQQAMDEIKAVLKKHDIGACVVLASETHMEYLREFSPTWSCVRIEEMPGGGWGIRIRAKRAEFPSLEAQKKCLEDSIGMLLGFADACEGERNQLIAVMREMSKVMDVQHMTIHEEPPTDEKR